MSELFLNILNMSISASWIVLAVIIFRLLLKKAPKWINVMLWGIVAIRLVCPFSFESVLSIIPSAQTIPTDIATLSIPKIDSGITVINEVVNPIITDNFIPTSESGVNRLQIIISAISIIWLIGVFAMLIYTVLSYIKVQSKIKTAVLAKDNIYQCETVGSPFVLGLIKPKIYLPFNISNQDFEYVTAHEQAHIIRKDHLWKPLGFLILSVYWFNPLLWFGYTLLCRDIELACDERVIKKLGTIERSNYSQALLNCSVNRRIVSACPLAFGEVGTKQRIKSVLKYEKPEFWIVVVSIMAIIAISVCTLTNPLTVKAESKGSLLSALTTTDNINEIYTFEIIHKYGGITTDITNNDDLEFLKYYTYSHEYPQKELHKLFVFPENQMIKVESDFQTDQTIQTMYLMNDGSLVIQAVNDDYSDTEVTYDVYTADSKYMLDEQALIKLLKKYGGYTINQN